jgi:hypothetical protein
MQAARLETSSAFFEQPVEPVGEIVEPLLEVLQLLTPGDRHSGDRPPHAFFNSPLQLAALSRQALAERGGLAADFFLAPARRFRHPIQCLAGLLFGSGGGQQGMAPEALENPGRTFQGGFGSAD